MPLGEAYDVVVVRDPTMTVGAVMTLSRDLAHLTGVKQADVELALQKGRFIVYPRLPSERVDAAAEQLRTMGAVVQIKPAEDTGPIDLEPDFDRIPPRPSSEFGGPVAHFSDSDLGLDSGAFNTGAGLAAAGSSYNEGIGRVLPSEDARTSRYQPVPRSPSSQMSLTDEDMRALVLGLETAKPQAPADEMQALADGLDAAAFDAPEIQTIDGMDGAAFDAAEEAAQKEAVSAGTAPPPPSGPEEELSLDVPAAPSGPPPEQSLQLDRPHQSSTSLSSSSMSQSSMSQAGMSQPAMSHPAYSGARAIPRPQMRDMEVPGDRGLLFEDSVANILGLVAVCSLLTMVLAFGITNATKRSEVTDLEEELSESYRNPLDVEFGDRRAPAQIEEELQKVYDSGRTRFLLVFALGIPLGLGLGRIRR